MATELLMSKTMEGLDAGWVIASPVRRLAGWWKETGDWPGTQKSAGSMGGKVMLAKAGGNGQGGNDKVGSSKQCVLGVGQCRLE